MTIFLVIAVAVGSYLIGNINMALLISKLKKSDIRQMGSGNPGSMNMFRNFGVKLGVLTMALDILKGAVPCLVGWFLLGDLGFSDARIGLHLAGLCVIIGHIFPVFLGFKGGKGIASSIGICMVAQPIVTLITLALGILFIILTGMGSITSFIIISIPLAVEGFNISMQMGSFTMVSLVFIFGLFCLTLFAHRTNVIKLFTGTENKTILFGKNKSAKKSAQDQ